MNATAISKATLGRLPTYLQYLRTLPKDSTISATALAKALLLGEVQVRKDLGVVSGKGRPKVGYMTQDLIQNIEHCLGSQHPAGAILVGAGKLGRALLDYDGFAPYGVDILAAFDCNTQILRLSGVSKEILPMSSLEQYVKEHHIKIGIITTGQGSAQEVCDIMVQSGITAIWNFAPCTLTVPQGVIQRQENLALSLAYLNNQIS